jgi:hypothetical protein
MNQNLVPAIGLLSLLLGACKSPHSNHSTLESRVEKLEEEKAQIVMEQEAGDQAELKDLREQLKTALEALSAERDLAPRVSLQSQVPDDAPGLNSFEEDPLDGFEPLHTVLPNEDYQIFFVELEKYGDWFQTENYGFVWQPDVVKTDPHWRPYTLGRWMHSDQGWVWVSDEPCGWAVYHYGRWVLLENHGWVWVPGEDWAPAWVAWRQSDDFIGWCPLPPETPHHEEYHFDEQVDHLFDLCPTSYSFVPIHYFHEPVIRHCLPRTTALPAANNGPACDHQE